MIDPTKDDQIVRRLLELSFFLNLVRAPASISRRIHGLDIPPLPICLMTFSQGLVAKYCTIKSQWSWRTFLWKLHLEDH